MLVSIVLGAVMLQQDSNDVQEKWAEVQAVWDGYAGVTGEMGDGSTIQKFALLRDGRYLVRTVATVNGQKKTVLVESFDGNQTTSYDVESNEYAVAFDQEPPTWIEPFQLLWGMFAQERKMNRAQEQLYDFRETSTSPGFMGFGLTFAYVGGGALMLRSRDMCPIYQLLIPPDAFGPTVDIERYPVCKPILYQRHCDREVEWSLPPGAKRVDELPSGR